MINRTFDYHALTAWNIHTKEKFSNNVPAFGARYTIVGDKVVFAPSPQRGSLPAYVWDLAMNHVQEIGNFSNLRLCHVDAADNILVAFECKADQPSEVQQTKWSITTGDLLEKKVFALPIPTDCPVFTNLELFRNPCRTYGRKTVAQSMFWNDHAPIYLEYDYAIDQLSVRWIDNAEVISRRGQIYRCVYLTRNLVYRFLTETMEVVVYNITTGAETLQPMLSEQGEQHPLIRDTERRNFNVFGDREVFGVANEIGLELWFFNPKFTPDLIPGGFISVPEVVK